MSLWTFFRAAALAVLKWMKAYLRPDRRQLPFKLLGPSLPSSRAQFVCHAAVVLCWPRRPKLYGFASKTKAA